MKKYAMFLVFNLVLFLCAGNAFAQTGQFGYGFSGPQGQLNNGLSGQFGYGQPQTVTASQARTFGHKAPVAMTGNLVQFYGGKDLYVFRDSSGDILVKIGPKEWQNLWYQGITIDPSNTIEIFGEVHWPKHSWGTPEVHVRFIKKV